jgi:3-hydroxymyristoyl/3-hydroxydecanoyl-(acyl carrier protein) dehydratase
MQEAAAAAHMASGTFTIAHDHPSLDGHFPGNPVVPGVVILDHAFAVIRDVLGCDAAAAVVRLRKVKFVSPLRPGEAVAVRFHRTGGGSDTAIAFDCLTAGRRPIATGTLDLSAAPADIPGP